MDFQKMIDFSLFENQLMFDERPMNLIIQLPRHGADFKVMQKIAPSIQINLTHHYQKAPVFCVECRSTATQVCLSCGIGKKIVLCFYCEEHAKKCAKSRHKLCAIPRRSASSTSTKGGAIDDDDNEENDGRDYDATRDAEMETNVSTADHDSLGAETFYVVGSKSVPPQKLSKKTTETAQTESSSSSSSKNGFVEVYPKLSEMEEDTPKDINRNPEDQISRQIVEKIPIENNRIEEDFENQKSNLEVENRQLTQRVNQLELKNADLQGELCELKSNINLAISRIDSLESVLRRQNDEIVQSVRKCKKQIVGYICGEPLPEIEQAAREFLANHPIALNLQLSQSDRSNLCDQFQTIARCNEIASIKSRIAQMMEERAQQRDSLINMLRANIEFVASGEEAKSIAESKKRIQQMKHEILHKKLEVEETREETKLCLAEFTAVVRYKQEAARHEMQCDGCGAAADQMTTNLKSCCWKCGGSLRK